tara:strand:- start:189 stop:587 length:399 start_codon:yes stop_codon:yes gene_type:complete
MSASPALGTSVVTVTTPATAEEDRAADDGAAAASSTAAQFVAKSSESSPGSWDSSAAALAAQIANCGLMTDASASHIQVRLDIGMNAFLRLLTRMAADDHDRFVRFTDQLDEMLAAVEVRRGQGEFAVQAQG